MNRIIISICLLLSFVVTATQSFAETFNINDIQYLITEIEEEAAELAGGAVAIISNDQVVYKKTFGHTKAGGAPIDENTLFALASVSKPIVSTSLAALADKGKVKFDDQIAINGLNLPLKSVLSHTTGYRVRGDADIEKGVSRKTLLGLLNKDTPKSGTSYSYSNTVYSLTEDYAQSKGYNMNELMSGLNIGSTVLPAKSNNLALPHGADKTKLNFPSNYQKIVPASAGVFASLNGMIEFVQIISGNRPNVVSQKTLAQLFTPVAQADDVFTWNILPFKNQDVNSSYCLGWRKVSLKSDAKSALVFHSGRINGATAFVGIIPDSKIGIVIMANQTSSFPLRNGLKIWKEVVLAHQ
ncbi:MAG: beta-lactamase family protein [Alphaproteobacteria bacterium]|jgi:beta-lactamase class C|nr:beta-lactamase family protein [Alphaproteobacteria bacterium]